MEIKMETAKKSMETEAALLTKSVLHRQGRII
jgi:hypothetical protein